MAYKTILLDKKDRVGVVTLNRPEALNALNGEMMDELTAALRDLGANQEIGAILLTGSDKAFAAGADIKEMAAKGYMDVFFEDFITANWEEATRVRKPIIAAVAGYALGGGCELAMMCDFIVCADNAKFGQPEIKLGVIPGAGGTQRLARFIGKSKAMDMILTGRMMDATEAESCGLVSRVFPLEDMKNEAFKIAQGIASLSLPSVMVAKEAINRAYEMSLSEGIRYERRVFHALFATDDQKEGMAAFIDKRSPRFKNK
ncbi:MAG: enoyl-CoA hydratase [Proteobacteria bacterium]|nr:enoyl-CoA hydratase [Pseudomonadota bacterium]